MMNEHHLRAALARGFEELARGRDAANDLLDLARSFNLKPDWSVVAEAVYLEQLARKGNYRITLGHAQIIELVPN